MNRQDPKTLVAMARIQRQIADCLRSGATLSSPKVLQLSRRLDRLVLGCYRS